MPKTAKINIKQKSFIQNHWSMQW